jgi:hypothetical protein
MRAPLAGEANAGALALSVDPSGPVIPAPPVVALEAHDGDDGWPPHATTNATSMATPLSINLGRDSHLSDPSMVKPLLSTNK